MMSIIHRSSLRTPSLATSMIDMKGCYDRLFVYCLLQLRTKSFFGTPWSTGIFLRDRTLLECLIEASSSIIPKNLEIIGLNFSTKFVGESPIRDIVKVFLQAHSQVMIIQIY